MYKNKCFIASIPHYWRMKKIYGSKRVRIHCIGWGFSSVAYWYHCTSAEPPFPPKPTSLVNHHYFLIVVQNEAGVTGKHFTPCSCICDPLGINCYKLNQSGCPSLLNHIVFSISNDTDECDGMNQIFVFSLLVF